MIKVRLKQIGKAAAIFFLIIIGILAGIIIHFFINLENHAPKEGSRFYSPYYIYISSGAASKAKSGEKVNILVLPNNSAGTSDDLNIHNRFALLQTFIGHIIFKELDTVILVPVFPRLDKEWQVYTHALDRDTLTTKIRELKRTDLQLNEMIDKTIQSLTDRGWRVNEQVLMWGHSASGMFVNRYTLLHPERVEVAVVYSPGGWPIAPVGEYNNNKLRYPIGINDIKELVGSNADLDIYKKIPHLFIIGSEDTNDSVPYSDSYDDEDRVLINRLFGATPIERWGKSEKIYKEVLQNVQFKTYGGMGHTPSLSALTEGVQFFKQILSEE